MKTRFHTCNLILIPLMAVCLFACSEEQSSASAPAADAGAPAAASSESYDAPATSGDVEAMLSNIEKAEGVVYQDEIYSKWPK